MQSDLIKKYNVPVPRYTSYPTVPYWEEQPMDIGFWGKHIKSSFKATNDANGISLYLHLPFCESLCTYCGCNKRITRNHQVEQPYILSLLQEWRHYLRLFGKPPLIREIHLGGGTPTFFSPQNLHHLLKNILDECVIHPQHHFGFEGNPLNTTQEHLSTLYSLGFRRLSLGVQDFDARVQKAVNRIHDFQNVAKVVAQARSLGYDSINFDLIYGLPFQTEHSIQQTFQKVGELKPDRIAFYSYAHIPWKSPSQRGYSEDDLPKESKKYQLYEIGKNMLLKLGYRDIGMDHFALENDGIYKAFQNGTLHRNFMGYTESYTDLLIGLGVSAISDCGSAYAQNVKDVALYQQQVESQGLPLLRGHFLSEQDRVIRDTILELICRGRSGLHADLLQTLTTGQLQGLDDMQAEGLIEYAADQLTITSKGKPFVRNICSQFDAYMTRSTNAESKFSKAI